MPWLSPVVGRSSAIWRSASGRSVGEIVDALKCRQPSVSKHLRVLRQVGLVRVRRDGRRTVCRVNADALRPLHEWTGTFEYFWRNQLRRVKERAERATKTASPSKKEKRDDCRHDRA
jgi:DNA-binding transcriptional ArsR family regulator